MIMKVLGFAAISAGIYLVMAFGLLMSQRPGALPQQEGLDFDNLTSSPFVTPQDPNFRYATYTGQGGAELPMTHVGDAETGPLVVMVHGSGWHGRQFDQLAWALRDVAEVKAITLRGHGANPERRGDIDYIGQFEDDIAPMLQAARDAGRKTVLLGHSSGGGLVVRFAGGTHGDLIDRAVLLAPFLHHNAPTMREASGGWSHVLLRRMIGLSMLNGIGITVFNHMRVIQFNFPDQVLDGAQGAQATPAYSYRLNTSYAPRGDYLADVAALPPFLLVAGTKDEAFVADQFEPVLAGANDQGRYVLVPEVGHLDIVNAPETERAIRALLHELVE